MNLAMNMNQVQLPSDKYLLEFKAVPEGTQEGKRKSIFQADKTTCEIYEIKGDTDPYFRGEYLVKWSNNTYHLIPKTQYVVLLHRLLKNGWQCIG